MLDGASARAQLPPGVQVRPVRRDAALAGPVEVPGAGGDPPRRRGDEEGCPPQPARTPGRMDGATFVALTGTLHREDEPSHIDDHGPQRCVSCEADYANACTHFCPGPGLPLERVGDRALALELPALHDLHGQVPGGRHPLDPAGGRRGAALQAALSPQALSPHRPRPVRSVRPRRVRPPRQDGVPLKAGSRVNRRPPPRTRLVTMPTEHTSAATTNASWIAAARAALLRGGRSPWPRGGPGAAPPPPPPTARSRAPGRSRASARGRPTPSPPAARARTPARRCCWGS